MKKNLFTWQLVLNSLRSEIPVMLLYVLHSAGSSPGRQGFIMAVNAKGQMSGSLGGGIMEHKFVEMAKASFATDQLHSDVIKQVHDKSAAKNQSGMICSGEQTIFLYQVNKAELPQVELLVNSLLLNQNGTLKLTNKGISFCNGIPAVSYSFEQKGNDFLLVEKTGYKNILHIIGGGHCALALSQLMSGMDFYIHVYDDRTALNTMEQNAFAHEKHIIDSYQGIGELIKEGNNVFVVVMTFGYRTDDIAVRSLLGHSFKYFGLLGSRKKVEKMFLDYRSEGIDEKLLSRINAPVGMGIKSQSPEEIAVSIAAEIISIKNKVQ